MRKKKSMACFVFAFSSALEYCFGIAAGPFRYEYTQSQAAKCASGMEIEAVVCPWNRVPENNENRCTLLPHRPRRSRKHEVGRSQSMVCRSAVPVRWQTARLSLCLWVSGALLGLPRSHTSGSLQTCTCWLLSWKSQRAWALCENCGSESLCAAFNPMIRF